MFFGFSNEETSDCALETCIQFSRYSWSVSVHWMGLIGSRSSRLRVAAKIVTFYAGDDHMYPPNHVQQTGVGRRELKSPRPVAAVAERGSLGGMKVAPTTLHLVWRESSSSFTGQKTSTTQGRN